MRIALKLTAGFVLIAALVGLVGYLTGRAGKEIQSQLEQLSRSAIVKVVDAANMASALDNCHRTAWALLADSRQAAPSAEGGVSAPRLQEARREIDDALDHFRQSLERSRMAAESLLRWADATGEPEVAARERQTTIRSLDRLDAAFADYRRLAKRFLVLAEADRGAAGDFLRTELMPHFNRELLPTIAAHRATAEADFTRGVRTAERATVTANNRNSVLTIVAMVGALGLGLVISRSIGRRLERLSRAARSVGQGDLDTRVPPAGHDEIGLLGQSFNRMVADLREKTVSIEEKDLLLREVHHRVKNNLQVISSLLNLQAHEAADPRVDELFQETQRRIRSMALIHEQLYRTGMLAKVDFAEYLDQLTTQLAGTFDAAGRSIRVRSSAEPIPLPLDRAIPCGMIVNELVSNAMKHAFPEGQGGLVEVGFRQEGQAEQQQQQYVLVVRDDGVGVPPAPSAEKPQTLGMKVVDALVRQLGGTLEIDSDQGTAFTVRFG